MGLNRQYGGLVMQILGVANSYASAPVTAPTSLSVSSVTTTTAVIAFTAPSNDGGSAITNYEFNLNGGAFTALNPADGATPVTITGLSGGTTYTVTLRAVNIVGVGPASAGLSVTSADSFNAATGGTITDYTEGGLNYRSHTFTSGGTFTLSSIGTQRSVQIMVQGGGGGGGYTQLGRGFGDGSGGAGGFATSTMLLPVASYQVTIGGGGSGVGGGGGNGGTGGQSSFGASTSLMFANGGGGGGTCEFCCGGGGGGGGASVSGALGTSNVAITGFNGNSGCLNNCTGVAQAGRANTYFDGTSRNYGAVGASSQQGCPASYAGTLYGGGGGGGHANSGGGGAGAQGIVIVRYRRA
jgi:hypothetical protein